MSPLRAAIKAAVDAYKKQTAVNELAKDLRQPIKLEPPIITGTTNISANMVHLKRAY